MLTQAMAFKLPSHDWELIYVLQYLQITHMHPCAHLLENVPLFEDSRPIMLEKWQQIWAWINEFM